MLIERTLAESILRAAGEYPTLAITGPRQAGKTTLAKACFPQKKYVTLEDPDSRAFALEDPRRFLASFPDGAVLDEVQRAPDLFSYLQGVVDADGRMGLFILTGSQHFGLLQGVTQSLAGRVALFSLSALSMEELDRSHRPLNRVLFEGAFPPIHARRSTDPAAWYRNYVATYLERDVRLVTNVADLSTFHRFLRLCAANAGQLINLSNIGRDAGVSHNTVRSWISVLEACGLVFLLQPYHANFSKRLVKTPKLYFCDTGLLCSLLGIEDACDLDTHRMRGEIFECWGISELMKTRLNAARNPNLYFWRDHQGHEVDAVIERAEGETVVEFKSGATIARDFFAGLEYWQTQTARTKGGGYLVYGGDEDQHRKAGRVLSWRRMVSALKKEIS